MLLSCIPRFYIINDPNAIGKGILLNTSASIKRLGRMVGKDQGIPMGDYIYRLWLENSL
jgi:hypothetical protein